MELNLKTLGFTKKELQQRVVDQLCKQVTSVVRYDEDSEEYLVDSEFAKQLKGKITAYIDKKISEMAEKHLFPKVSEYIENLTLQETNRWGEAKGKSLTFIEYLVQRAEAYMLEKVDYDGKSQEESRGFSWSGKQTRLANLIHQHLHYSIANAMEKALKDANSHITQGLEQTVKIKLEEISKSLKVGLNIGRR